MRRYQAPFVLEGGAIHTDGQGTLLTTESVLLNPNRNPGMTKADMEEQLGLYLGVRKVIWLPQGLKDDDTDGHIDNLAAFVRPGHRRGAHQQRHGRRQLRRAGRQPGAAAQSATDATGKPLEVLEIEQPKPRLGREGRRMTMSYINFYVCNEVVIVMPAFEDAQDRRAFDLFIQGASPSARSCRSPPATSSTAAAASTASPSSSPRANRFLRSAMYKSGTKIKLRLTSNDGKTVPFLLLINICFRHSKTVLTDWSGITWGLTLAANGRDPRHGGRSGGACGGSKPAAEETDTWLPRPARTLAPGGDGRQPALPEGGACDLLFRLLAVATIFLVPAYRELERNLLTRLEQGALASSAALFRLAPADAGPERIIAAAASLLPDTPLLGGTLYAPNGDFVGSFGEPPRFAFGVV